MRVIDTRTSVPYEDRIRDEAAPTDTNEQIAARAEELARTIGDNDRRRVEGNKLVNQPAIHFGGAQLPELSAAPALPSVDEIAKQLRCLADELCPPVDFAYVAVITVSVHKRNGVVQNILSHTVGQNNSIDFTLPYAFSEGDRVVFAVTVH